MRGVKAVGVALALVAGSLCATVTASAETYEVDPTYPVTHTGDPNRWDYVEDLVVQPDGRALVATWGNEDLTVHRFLAGGGLDPSWGSGGHAALDGGSFGVVGALALQPDGKVVVVGDIDDNTTPGLLVARFLANGQLDPDFGFGGEVVLDPGTYVGRLSAVTIGPGGAIVVAGDIGSGNEDVVVLRLTADGDLDPTFGGGSGIALTSTPRMDYARDVVVDSAGVITVLGQTASNSGTNGATSEYDAFLYRYLPDGSLDPSFDGDGIVTTDFGAGSGSYDDPGAIALDSGGRVVISGSRATQPQGDADDGVFVARYSANGALDPTFGLGAGQGFFGDFNWYGPDGARTLERDGLGRWLVSGLALGQFDGGVGLRRFDGNGTPDPSLVPRGRAVADLAPNLGESGLAAMAPGGTFVIASQAGGTVDGHNDDLYVGRLRVTAPQPGPGAAAPPASSSPAAPPSRSGYWMVTEPGDVYAFGDAPWLGNAAVGAVAAVDLEPTPSGNGYWIVDRLGHVFSFGDAPYLGGINGAVAFGETVTSISRTPGRGYWLFTSRGRVVAFGDAPHVGDMSATRLNGPVLDAIPTPSGQGYYLVGSDGGIFTFGDATFVGSMGSVRLNAPVQSLVPDPDGSGYWLVASDGGIFAFDAAFYGSMGDVRLNRPVTGMVGSADGYLMVAEDGGIFTFGSATFRGSLGDHPPARPVVAVATLG